MTGVESEAERLERLMRDRIERPLPKRFYKLAQASDDNRILLDGRPVKSPLKAVLQLPNRGLAEAVAAEWAVQGDVVNPALMPFTRLANTAIDRATAERANILAEIEKYAGNDLVCYWADRPPELVQRQRAHWQPVLDWATDTLGTPPIAVVGLTHQPQPDAMLQATRQRIAALNNWQLTAIYLLTTLTGSALIALMQSAGQLAPEAAWAAANVDEDYQISQWGEDWEAKIRREARRREFEGLVQFLALL
jgi:chaperone required for assembly of F1-ATPase